MRRSIKLESRMAFAVQSDSVRRPTHFLHIYLIQSQLIHNNLTTLANHFLTV